MITLSVSAYNKIKQQITKRKKGLGIQIGVKTTGCSGLAYTLEFFDSVGNNDTMYNMYPNNDILVVVDRKNEPYLNGLHVDYVKNGLNEGFEFTNPNERDRCGCGSSFRV